MPAAGSWIGLAGLRLDERDDAVDQRARREVLAGAALGLAGVLLEQAFVQVAQAVLGGAEPVDAVQAPDQLLQVARLLQAGLRVGVDGGDQRVVAAAQFQQRLAVVVQQVQAAQARQRRPARVLGQLVLGQDAAGLVLVLHLDEEQQHQLGHVVAVVDAVVAQHVAKVPELLDDVVLVHGFYRFEGSVFEPVGQLQAGAAFEVARVAGDEGQAIGNGDGGDLAVGVIDGPA